MHYWSEQDLVDGFRTCVWQPLPEGWEQHVDPCTCRPYFVDCNTGEKTWDRPLVPAGTKVGLSPLLPRPLAMWCATSAGSE